MKTSSWMPMALAAIAVFGELVLAIALFRLQVMDVAESTEVVGKQTKRTIKVAAQRGRICDRRGEVLAECRPSHCIDCYLEYFGEGSITNIPEKVDAALDRLSRLLALPRETTLEQVRSHLKTSRMVPLTVWQGLDERTLARFCEHAHEFPGFVEQTDFRRHYPHGSLAAHVLGYTGLSVRNGPNDLPVHFSEKELVGRDGVEFTFNDYLTGVAGLREVRVDARGLPIRETSPVRSANDIDPSAGLDLALTLDASLQAEVERQLEGVTGACVCLDPRDGAVLALASSPTYNPNQCVPRISHAVYASLTNAPMKRGQNRAIAESYAPGSTFKPITALAGLRTGWLDDDEYVCQGVYRLGSLRLHCSNRYGHGPITVRGAIKESCNSFFCNLGTALGTNAVLSAAAEFGLGRRTGVELPGEVAGVLPDGEWKLLHYNEPWYPGDTCQMCIGQGMLLTTPLQMAVVASALANGGRVVRPYLILGEPREAESVPKVNFSEEAIELVRQGMRDVVEGGTGSRVYTRVETLPTGRRERHRLKVSCGAKTGTAEIGAGASKRKNTWVIAFAPFEEPTIAMAMIVERGESGGSTVAPRIHNVFAHLFGEAEPETGRRN